MTKQVGGLVCRTSVDVAKVGGLGRRNIGGLGRRKSVDPLPKFKNAPGELILPTPPLEMSSLESEDPDIPHWIIRSVL